MKLLLVEDDPAIGEGVKMGLGASGFTVDWACTGNDALAALGHTSYDLMVLDLGLPDLDGLVLLGSGGTPERPPTLVLSARHLTSDRIEALNLGADDYLVKPFDFDELVARLHALHRRNGGRRDPIIQLGALAIDPLRRQARRDGQNLPLSPREFDLLLALAEQPGAVRSPTWLENRLYRWGDEVASNAVQVHLHHLRKKLGEGWIVNVRGVGYRLMPPDTPCSSDAPESPAPTT